MSCSVIIGNFCSLLLYPMFHNNLWLLFEGKLQQHLKFTLRSEFSATFSWLGRFKQLEIKYLTKPLDNKKNLNVLGWLLFYLYFSVCLDRFQFIFVSFEHRKFDWKRFDYFVKFENCNPKTNWNYLKTIHFRKRKKNLKPEIKICCNLIKDSFRDLNKLIFSIIFLGT